MGANAWSQERPSVAGWYWLILVHESKQFGIATDDPEIVFLDDEGWYDGLSVWSTKTERPQELLKMDERCLWIGPFPVPAPPRGE